MHWGHREQVALVQHTYPGLLLDTMTENAKDAGRYQAHGPRSDLPTAPWIPLAHQLWIWLVNLSPLFTPMQAAACGLVSGPSKSGPAVRYQGWGNTSFPPKMLLSAKDSMGLGLTVPWTYTGHCTTLVVGLNSGQADMNGSLLEDSRKASGSRCGWLCPSSLFDGLMT